MATTLKPRNGLVVIKMMEDKEQKSAAGIILPKGRGAQFILARVLEVGPGVWDAGKQCATGDLQPGQLVLVKSGVMVDIGQGAQSFLVLESEGGKIGLVNQHDIIAICEGTPDGPVKEQSTGPKLVID